MNNSKRKGKNKLIFFAISLFVLVYAFVFLISYAKEYYFDYKVKSYDLDGDGIFSKEEQTDEWLIWSDRQIGDGGLILLPIVAPIVAFIVTIFVMILIVLFKRCRVKK